ncbi:MAG: Ig-like domain-containing protein [Pseudooceanicola sp.]
MVDLISNEERVNIFTPGNQYQLHMAELNGGGYVSVWRSENQNGSGDGLVAQIFNEFGEAVGVPLFIEESTLGNQLIGGVSGTSDGGFVVTWDTGDTVFARKFGADGTAETGEFVVNSNGTSYNRSDTEVTGLSGGGYVVTWRAYNPSTNSYDIEARVYDATDNPLGAEFVVNATTMSGNQGTPRIAALGTGFVSVWVDESGNDGANWGVFAQRYDATGSPVGAEIVVNTNTTGSQYEPDVVELNGGRFVVVWRDDANATDGSNSGVFAQVFEADGTAVGGEILISQTTQSYQYEPAIAATADGGFFVAWNSYATADGTTYDVLGRHFDANGAAQSDEIIITQDGNGSSAQRPDVVALDNGAVIVSWDYNNYGTDSDGRSVYQRVLELPGSNIAFPVPPILEAFDPAVTFTESELQGGPQILDASGAVAVSGPADFDGGRLSITRITSTADSELFNDASGLNDDVLGIRDQGVGAGQIGVSGTDVTYGGTVIGTIVSDGADGAALVIVFNANADAAAVEALAENLTYSNPSDDPAESVQLAIRLEDGDGGSSDPSVVTITVIPEDDAPRPVFGSDFEVNTFFASTQHQPVVAALPDGGWVVMWESYSQDSFSANNYGIIGQRYDANGAPVGPEFLVNTQTAGSQQQVDVEGFEAGANAGGFVAVWYDGSNPTDGYVRAQLFDATSQKAGGEIMVPANTFSTQDSPQVETFADGSFAVVWRNYVDNTDRYEITVRLFDDTGTATSGDIVVNEVSASEQEQPDITELAGGGFAVTWRTYDTVNTNYDVATRVFDASGVPVSGEMVVNTARDGTQTIPKVAGLVGGGYVVVWEDQAANDGSNDGVFAQLFSATGVPVGEQFLVNELTQSAQGEPVVTALPGGGFAVAFYSLDSDYDGYDIVIQHYDATGNRVDGEIRVNQDTTGSQYEPELATLANGDVVVVWRDDSGRDGSGAGIVMQIVGDPANYAGAVNNPVLSVAQPVVTFDEADVNAGPQILFAGVDVGDADSADFDGGVLRIFRAGAAQAESLFQAPDDESQDNLGIRDQGNGPGQIGVSGTSVTFGGTVIATITSDGSGGSGLILEFNANATPAAVEALLQNVTYQNPSDDPSASRDFRVILTDGDGGTSIPVDVTVQITEDSEGFVALSPERQVNTYEESAQDVPAITTLNDGGYFVAWQSYDQDGGTFDRGIYGQRFDANGQAVGDEFQINTDVSGNQYDVTLSAIAPGDGGGFVAVWQDTNNSAGYIKAQVFNEDGTPRGTEFMVETEVYSTQQYPSVTQVNGGFLVTWGSFNDETNTYDIRGQRFDGNGTAVGAEFDVQTTNTAGQQTRPHVATDSAGNVVVVWEDQSGADGNSYAVFGQRIDSSGSLVGAQFQVNETTQGSQYLPRVDYLADGRFVVTWYDDSAQDGSGGAVFARLYAADGTAQTGEFLVNELFSSTQIVGDVIGLSDGGFAIAYSDSSGADGSGWGTFLQLFNDDGSRRDGAVQINEEVSSTQNEVRLTEVFDGINYGIAATWTSTTSSTAGDGSGNGVFTRIFGIDGTLQPANFAPELDNLDQLVQFAEADIGTPTVIDNSFDFSDADSADFDGGTVELRFLDYRATSDDNLSVVAGKGITVSGSDVLYDGVVIGTISGSEDGANGADLVISLNANANAANVRYLLEQMAYSSTNPVVGSERSVGFRVTDGDGGISAGRSVRIHIESSVTPAGIELAQLDDSSTTESAVEGGVRLDPAVDFDYTLANGFDGGYVELLFRDGLTGRLASQFETLGVADDGTGTNQIGVSGSNITFQGVVIGTIDGTMDGQGGNDLRINLNAAANEAAVDALIEAFTYSNNSDGPADNVRFNVRVYDAAAQTTGNTYFDLAITPEIDGATVPLGDESQVNAFTTGEQTSAAITELSDGGYVITWQSYNQDSSEGSNWGVYQQRYNAAGEPVGPEILVNETTSGNQDQPDVAGLTGGGWVTVWDGTDSSGGGVFGRVYDANGNPGAEFQVNLQDSSTQRLPAVAALSNGNFVVTWESTTSGGAGDGNGYGVIGRVFDSAGNPVTPSDIVLNTYIDSTQQLVDVAGLTGGGFVAVWESNGVDGSGYGIAFQRFDNSGVPQGGETIVNTTTDGSQNNAQIAELTDGGFVIVWESADGSNDGVFMQRYDALGNAVGGEVQVSDWNGNAQIEADVTGTTDGGWVVTYYDNSSRNSFGGEVYAQRYDSAGNRIDGSFVVNEEGASTQSQAVLATLSDGRVVVAWTSQTSGDAGDGSGNGIFTRLFGLPGQAQSGNPSIGGIADIALDEADLNAGYTQVFAPGSVSVADLDSADFDGGRLMIHVVRDYAAAEQFLSPDDLDQDVMTFAGTGISIAGTDVSVNGTVIGTLEADGQNGAGLQVLLNANATAELVETLLGGLNYANPSNDPRATREVEVTLSDGDGGVTDHTTFTISIAPETDGFEKVGDEQQVNSYTNSTQHLSDVAGLAGGGHVVVWGSYTQDNPGSNDYGVFAQRFDVDGQPVGPEFQVNTTFAGGQDVPQVVALADGSFVVAWEGNGIGDNDGVFAQRFEADGTPIGTEFRLNDDTASADREVALTALESGGFVAAWRSYAGADDIEARIYDATGTPIGLEFVVNASPTGSQLQPAVTTLSNGNIVFTWYDSETSNVTSRVFDATGTAVTGEITVNTNNQAGTQSEPAVTALSGGGYVVVWTDSNATDGSSDGVYAQIFTAGGVAVGDTFLVNEFVSSQQDNPQVVGTPDGGFVVAFRDTSGVDGSGQGVFIQQYDSSGNRIDGQFLVNTETLSTQHEPAIDVLANGSIVVTWTSATSGTAGDGSADGIFSQIVGDPSSFNLVGRPILQGINPTVTFMENALNIGPQLIDANAAVALSDIDSSDFDGGFVRVDNVIVSRGYQDQVAAPDNFTQDNLGLRQASGISIVGTTVSVDGTAVGEIVSDGVAGSHFQIELNANATVAIVELLVENLTYRNTSDDPEPTRVVRVQVGDGDGGVSDPSLVTVNITAEIDGAAPVFGERQANTTTDGNQEQSDVARLEDGGFVIVWQSYNQDASNTWGVYGQRFDANGNAVDGEFEVNTNLAGSQYEASVTALPGGGWVVVWRDDSGLDGSNSGVFMQRYASDGSKLGAEDQVNTYTSSHQYEPEVTVLANGDYVVTYTSWNNTAEGGNGYDVYIQRYMSNGTPIGSEELVNTEVSATQEQPEITALENGGFAVVWTSQTSGSAGDGDSNGVFYQIYGDSASGYAAIGGELQANGYIANAQDNASIAGLTGGGYVIVWESNGQDGSAEGVFAQQFDANGNAVSQEFRVNDQRSSSQYEPQVAALSNGGYVIVFTDLGSADGSSAGVYAQQYAANGNRIDGAIQVNTEFSSNQNQASVAGLDSGGFVVSWTSDTSGTAGDGSGHGVFYQVFSNSAPVVTDVSATTAEDTNLVFDSSIFEAGYADAEGQLLAEIRIDVLPSAGTLQFNGSPVAPGQIITVAELDAGALVFVPPLDFNGTADFGWTGSDGTTFAQTIAQTNITVTPVNDPVGLQAINNQTITEGSNLNINAILDDPDNDTFVVTVDYGEGAGPQSFNTTSKTPSLVNYYEAEGVYTVDLTVDDQNGSVESISFTVTVENGPPVALNNSYSTDEDTAVSGVNIFNNDNDPGNDPFTISAIDGTAYTPGTVFVLASGASVTVAANGDLVYDPTTSATFQALADGESANDSFVYQITDDDGATDSATVFFTISGADDNVNAQDDAFTVDEDSVLNGNVFNDNGNGPDIDPEGDNLTVVSINGSTSLVGAPFAVSGGGVLQVNSDGTVSFIATNEYNELGVGETRVITFTYVVEEDGSNLTASASAEITITGVNDDPTAQDDSYGTDINTPLNFDPKTNDFDVDGDTFTITSVGTPSNGTAVLEADGTITYTPGNGYSGPDSFTYEITDENGATDTATVTISVSGSNAPVALNDAVTTDEDTPLSGDVFADNGNGADFDPEGDAFSVTAVNGQGANVGTQITLGSGALLVLNSDGTFDYDPNGAFEGLAANAFTTDTFSYTITDAFGGVDTATVTVTVDGVNDAPTMDDGAFGAVEDGSAALFNLATVGDDVDSDDNGGSLSYAITTGPGEGSASIAGTTLSFDPGSDFQDLSLGETREITVGVTATDSHGAVSNEGTMTITVTGVNDDPTLVGGVLAADEDGAPVMLDLATLGDDVDSEDDGASLSYAIISGPSEGGASISGSTLTFDPGSDFQDLGAGDTRQVTVSIQATDARGATSTIEDVVVTVTGENDDPDAVDDSASTGFNTPVNIDVLANDTDIDQGTVLTVISVGNPSNGTAVLEADGTITYTPANGYGGSDSFTYEISDGEGGTSTATVNITVTSNLPPVAEDDDVSTDEDTAVSGNVLADNGNGADSDPDGDPFNVTAVNGQAANVGTQIALASGALLLLNAEGSFDYDPNGVFETLSVGDSAIDSFTYTITDGNGLTDTATVTVTVDGVNDDPTLTAGAANAVEDGAPVLIDLSLLGDDVDSEDDGTSLSYAIVGGTPVSEGSVSLNGTELSFDPGADFQDLSVGETRDIVVQVQATDAQGGLSTIEDMTFTVTGVNDDPTLTAGAANAVEDGAPVLIDLSLLGDDVDSEDDGTSLSYAIVGGTPVNEGSVSLNGTELSFDPGADFQDLSVGETRDIVVQVQATDAQGGTSTIEDMTFTVTGVNDDPTLIAGAAGTMEDGSSVAIDLSALGDDIDSEDDGASLTYAIVGGTPVSEGSVSLNGTILTFDPGADFQDLAEGETRDIVVQVQATDAQGGTSTVEDMTFTVTGVNDAPVIVSADTRQVDENTNYVMNVVANDPDSVVSYAITGGADAGLFTIDANSGVLAFVMAPDYELPEDDDGDNFYEVEVTATDGALSDTQTIAVEVLDVDEGGGYNVIEGTPQRDVLIGTAGADHFIFHGGMADVAIGNGGADLFDLSGQMANGMQDVTRIMDWDGDDTLTGLTFFDVNTATVSSTDTYLSFEYGPDDDVLIISGEVPDGFGSIFGVFTVGL